MAINTSALDRHTFSSLSHFSMIIPMTTRTFVVVVSDVMVAECDVIIVFVV